MALTAAETAWGCTYQSKAIKRKRKIVSLPGDSGSFMGRETDFPQTIRTELITNQEELSYLTDLKKKKKTLFVDYFHFLLGTSLWQRSETGVPKCQRVCEGSYELWINPHRGSYFDWPWTNYIWRLSKLACVCRCFNARPESISQLADGPANGRLQCIFPLLHSDFLAPDGGFRPFNLRPQSQNNECFQPSAGIIRDLHRLKVVSAVVNNEGF